MATRLHRVPEIQLIPWADHASAAQRRATFSRKHAWTVNAPRTSALWYKVVLSNLLCTYVRPEAGTMSAVRDVLSDGLSRSAFNRLRWITGAPTEELRRAVRISRRTMARREKFKPGESERILRVTSAFQKALEVFGELEGARRWFSTPKAALGEKTPLEFCDTGPGAEEVEDLLGRIEHGVYS